MKHILPAGVAALISATITIPANAQLILHQNQPPNTLVESIMLGQGVEVDSVTFNGAEGDNIAPVGTGFSEIGRFNGSNSVLGLDAGIFICNGVAQVHMPGPNQQLSQDYGGIGAAQGIQTPDNDLCMLTGWDFCETGNNIYSKGVLEYDFIADNDMVSFRYVFSSEEYERWVCTEFNDVFGWFISGPGISGPFSDNAINIAYIPGSLSYVSINTVNSGAVPNNANGDFANPDPFHYCTDADANWLQNTAYYRYNGGQWPTSQPLPGVPQLEAPYNNDPYYIAHNGMTVVLTASAAVEIGQRYHMKMAVGNARDSRYPSAVYIEQSSFRASDRFTLTVDPGPNVDLSGSTPVLHQSATQEVQLRINRWGGFYLAEEVLISVGGDAIAGVDYQPALPTSLHFDQLDSAATFRITLPVGNDPSDLAVTLTTGTGQKAQTFPLSIVQESTVGIASTVAPLALEVFPNPVGDVLRATPGAGYTTYRVLNALGQEVQRGAVVNGRIEATTPAVSGGYLLHVEGPGKQAVARFVK